MTLRVGLAQMDSVVGDIDGNTSRILERWHEAADQGCDLVLFPELAVTGYPPEDLLLKPEFVQANLDAIDRLRDEGPAGTVAIVGYVGAGGDRTNHRHWDVAVSARGLTNSAGVIADGRLVGTYNKWRLPNYGVFDEARYFVSDDHPLVFRVAGVPVGVTICEDLWVEHGPVARAARDGARVIANLNASPYHCGKRAEREHWVRHHTTESNVHLCYVNMVGGQDEVVFDGDSMIAGPDGRVVTRGAQFAEDLIVVDLDTEEAEAEGADLRGHPGDRPAALPERQDDDRLDLEAEVWQALVLGVRDYCRKNGFTDAVIGVSGGIDSAVTVAVAVDALGADHVTAIAMPSPYSSEHSLQDAEELASLLGVRYQVIPIESAMKSFDSMLAPLFDDLPADETEENIQARIRGIVLMGFSNKFGSILLSTGNKTEMAVGYATLYGDMAGGFAVLKDVPKLLVFRLARYRNTVSPAIPERTITKPPSAELRPGQRDEDSLPPYDVLDPIVAAYVEDDLGIDDIVAKGFDEDVVREVLRKIDVAEYKRRQAPPGVKITDRAFGKDRRVPITNYWRS